MGGVINYKTEFISVREHDLVIEAMRRHYDFALREIWAVCGKEPSYCFAPSLDEVLKELRKQIPEDFDLDIDVVLEG